MEVNVWTVFLAALVTALMTGFGALPFVFVKKVSDKWLKLSNAMASGLMLAASHSLIAEGAKYSPERTIIGAILGLIAVILSKKLIKGKEPTDYSEFFGTKALLILGIMTAHSFAEGVGVGVSFGGSEVLGVFITTAISLHNIPEGLAISLVLIPRGTSVLKAAGWSIFSSLPQILMAVPAFLFVNIFKPFLPIGLGLAAGAMIWMVFEELIPEAIGKEPEYPIGFTVTAVFIAMLAFQLLVLQ